MVPRIARRASDSDLYYQPKETVHFNVKYKEPD
jgi:hypothetical protein